MNATARASISRVSGARPATLLFCAAVALSGGVLLNFLSDLTFWRDTHRNLAAQSPKSSQRIVDGAEHEIWRTHEAAVLQAVAAVVSGNP